MTVGYTWDVFCTLDGYGSYGPDGDWGGYWSKQSMPATVISSSLHDTLGWPDATLVSGDAGEIVSRLKEESDMPLRSQASLSLNRLLMAAGLVDRIELTIFPVISGRTGTNPVLAGAGDFDLELLESRTFDGRSQLLVYRPTAHG